MLVLPPPTRPRRGEPPVGLIFVLSGLVLVAVGTFALPWTAADGRPTQTEMYADLMSTAVAGATQTFADLYFSILGLLLMVLVAILSVRGTWPARFGQRRRVHRTLATMACAVAVAALLTAVRETGEPAAGPGVTATGYVLVLIGVIVGPSRRQRRSLLRRY
jgi:hypothetical protein